MSNETRTMCKNYRQLTSAFSVTEARCGFAVAAVAAAGPTELNNELRTTGTDSDSDESHSLCTD